jgi:serine/threonine protein phosphatase 1
MPGATYAIADLHGRFDILEAALAAIAAHASQPGTIVFLGDYVDRGPQSKQIIDRLMAGPPPGWTWVCLKGNHEDMMFRCVGRLAEMPWWIGNGGAETLFSYGHPTTGRIDPGVVPNEHLSWLFNLPPIYVDRHRVFVHAGVDPTVPLDEQREEVLLWKLYNSADERGHRRRHVVHGHEQFAEGPILLAGRSDLDTFAWFTGRIVVGVFDDGLPGGPVDLIEVRCEPTRSRDLTNYMVAAMTAEDE